MCIPLRTLLSAVFILTWISGPTLAANSIPVITPIPPLSLVEGKTLSYKVTATDADRDPITLSASGLKTWMSFSAGTFTATPDYTKSGTYIVKFIAKDGTSQSSANATITVSNVNRSPTFGTLSSKTVAEGGTLTTTVTATDPDGDLVTITASGLKTWMTFSGSTLTLKPGYSDSGSYSVTFTASDGKLSTTASLPITVTGTNQAPVIGTVPALTTAEGATFSHTVIVSDADGDPVTLSASGLQSWMSLSGTTFSASPGYTSVGTYAVTLTASDGLKQSTGSLTLTVANTNRAPVLDAVGNWPVGESKVLSRPITATDQDGDAVTVSASGLQSWMSFDGRSFRARPGTGTSGTYIVSFIASDNALSDTETVTVTVTRDGASFPLPWNQYVGSVGSGATWASWSRNPLYNSTGIALVWDPSQITNLLSATTEILQAKDAMLPTVGFSVGSPGEYANLWAFLDYIHDGGVASYQQAVRTQVETLAPLDPSGRRIVYQLGNEITNYIFSEGVRLWAAGRGIVIPGVAMAYDPDYIPYYVEYHLAPTVEAMLDASYTAYGDAGKVTIALGSVGNGGSATAKTWLDLLLNTTVKGTYAPSLAGKRVYELVDFASVHYVGGTANIEPVWDKWNGVGTVRGLWTTEEIGKSAAEQGRGATRAIITVTDHLNWYYKRGLNQEQVRVALYDWNINGPVAGTSADTAMLALFDFFGAASLEPRTDVVTAEVSSGGVMSYQLQSLSEDAKRVIALTLSDTSATISGITFGKLGWSGVVDATVHVFSPSGHSVTPVTVADEGDHFRIMLTQPIQLLDDGYSTLITLQRR